MVGLHIQTASARTKDKTFQRIIVFRSIALKQIVFTHLFVGLVENLWCNDLQFWNRPVQFTSSINLTFVFGIADNAANARIREFIRI